MGRVWNGTTDYIASATAAALAGFSWTYGTLAAVCSWTPSANNTVTLFGFNTSTALLMVDNAGGVDQNKPAWWSAAASVYTSAPITVPSGVPVLLVATKTTGTVAMRAHVLARHWRVDTRRLRDRRP